MYTNVAYLNNTIDDIEDFSKDLIITSCGYYRVQNKRIVKTERPFGRRDFQLLYIAKGKTHFYFDGQDNLLTEGTMILFRPKESQFYYYYAKDKPEIYWVHFTGFDVENILQHYGLPKKENTFYVGISSDYQYFYQQMIKEMQLCRINYEELLTILLRRLFIAINRYLLEDHKSNSEIQNKIEKVIHFFNKNYNQTLNIDEIATNLNMSTCYFIRCFKQIVKTTPLHYLLSLRMSNAKSLLSNTNYNIAEVAESVGYDNSLYFSRLFHKHTGFSPTEYRKQFLEFKD